MNNKQYFRKGEEHKIENYELARLENFEGWCIHHRLELTVNNEFANTKEELIRMDMYFNRPYFELIYMKQNEHKALHNKANNNAKNCNWRPNKEQKSKISIAMTGRHINIETRQKIKGSLVGRNKSLKHKLSMVEGCKKRGNSWTVINGKRVWINKTATSAEN